MVSIRHATPSADRPAEGIGDEMWDELHDVPVATQAEAEAGAATDKLMTPQRTAQAIAARSLTITTFTNEAAFNAATPGQFDLLVLVDA